MKLTFLPNYVNRPYPEGIMGLDSGKSGLIAHIPSIFDPAISFADISKTYGSENLDF